MADASLTVAAAWGSPLPDWVAALADECDRRASQASVARSLGYSASTINQVLHNKYPGDQGRVEQKIRGVLLAETIDCPAAGTMRRDACLAHQGRGDVGSPLRVRLFRACRGGCPHSRHKN
jgi:hypothetical protein